MIEASPRQSSSFDRTPPRPRRPHTAVCDVHGVLLLPRNVNVILEAGMNGLRGD